MKSKIVSELKRIAEENDGILQPAIVVDEARPVSSPLHKRFEWNNGKAAQEYRLWQARQLIRVVVETIAGSEGKHEVFVSLTTDRKDGGYRVMAEVLSDKSMREQMLMDAKCEMELFHHKYVRLRELSLVFKAIKKTAKKLR
jgi:hypothetical protein